MPWHLGIDPGRAQPLSGQEFCWDWYTRQWFAPGTNGAAPVRPGVLLGRLKLHPRRLLGLEAQPLSGQEFCWDRVILATGARPGEGAAPVRPGVLLGLVPGVVVPGAAVCAAPVRLRHGRHTPDRASRRRRGRALAVGRVLQDCVGGALAVGRVLQDCVGGAFAVGRVLQGCVGGAFAVGRVLQGCVGHALAVGQALQGCVGRALAGGRVLQGCVGRALTWLAVAGSWERDPTWKAAPYPSAQSRCADSALLRLGCRGRLLGLERAQGVGQGLDLRLEVGVLALEGLELLLGRGELDLDLGGGGG